VTDLSNEGSDARHANNLIPAHGSVQGRCKNAGFRGRLREYLQRLLRGNRHGFLQAKKSRSMAGKVCGAGTMPSARAW
jgi:hypothetical protein